MGLQKLLLTFLSRWMHTPPSVEKLKEHFPASGISSQFNQFQRVWCGVTYNRRFFITQESGWFKSQKISDLCQGKIVRCSRIQSVFLLLKMCRQYDKLWLSTLYLPSSNSSWGSVCSLLLCKTIHIIVSLNILSSTVMKSNESLWKETDNVNVQWWWWLIWDFGFAQSVMLIVILVSLFLYGAHQNV